LIPPIFESVSIPVGIIRLIDDDQSLIRNNLMSKFMLFVRGGYNSEIDLSAEEIQQRIGKYRAWSGNLAQAGKLLDANKISDEPHVLVCENGEFKVQTPAPNEETVGGYFVVEAENYDEALTMARECPIFEHGGSLEVRRIES
jgi:hypothetical protein